MTNIFEKLLNELKNLNFQIKVHIFCILYMKYACVHPQVSSLRNYSVDFHYVMFVSSKNATDQWGEQFRKIKFINVCAALNWNFIVARVIWKYYLLLRQRMVHYVKCETHQQWADAHEVTFEKRRLYWSFSLLYDREQNRNMGIHFHWLFPK
jgi:hypothetical protein